MRIDRLAPCSLSCLLLLKETPAHACTTAAHFSCTVIATKYRPDRDLPRWVPAMTATRSLSYSVTAVNYRPNQQNASGATVSPTPLLLYRAIMLKAAETLSLYSNIEVMQMESWRLGLIRWCHGAEARCIHFVLFM